MIEVPIYNENREEIGKISFDEAKLGGLKDGKVNGPLLKQAIVRYHANLRQGTVKTKNKGKVEGSTRKLYRQKGTGNARRGPIRTPVMKGGGHAHHKEPREFRQDMPKKARRLANQQAILSKFLDNQAIVLDKIELPEIGTRRLSKLLEKFEILEKGAVIAVPSPADEAGKKAHQVLHLSSRNIQKIELRPVPELNTWDVLRRRHLVFTKDALLALVGGEATVSGK